VAQIPVTYVRFEFVMAVTMKNAIFWDMTLYGSCKNQRFSGTYHLHFQGQKHQHTAKKRSSKTSVLTRAIQRHIPENGVLHVTDVSGSGLNILSWYSWLAVSQ
jgi:hypothetical protein